MSDFNLAVCWLILPPLVEILASEVRDETVWVVAWLWWWGGDGDSKASQEVERFGFAILDVRCWCAEQSNKMIIKYHDISLNTVCTRSRNQKEIT